MKQNKKLFDQIYLYLIPLVSFLSFPESPNSSLKSVVNPDIQALVDRYGDWDAINFTTWSALHQSGYSWGKEYWYPYGNLLYVSEGLFGAIFQRLSLPICILILGIICRRILKQRTRYNNNWHRILILLIQSLGLFFEYDINFIRYIIPFILLMYSLLSLSEKIIHQLPMAIYVHVLTDGAIFSYLILIGGLLYLKIFLKNLGLNNKVLLIHFMNLIILFTSIFQFDKIQNLYHQATIGNIYSSGNASQIIYDDLEKSPSNSSFLTLFMPWLLLIVLLYLVYVQKKKNILIIHVITLIFADIYIFYLLYRALIWPNSDTNASINILLIIINLLLILCVVNKPDSIIMKTFLIISSMSVLFYLSQNYIFHFANIKSIDGKNLISEFSRTYSVIKNKKLYFKSDWNQSILNYAEKSRPDLLELSAILKGKSFYILGDYPNNSNWLYAINKAVPPYSLITFANSSKKIEAVSLKRIEKLNQIVIPKNTQEFIGIPVYLRQPEIFNYIVNNFILATEMDNHFILERSKVSNLSFFEKEYGNSVDLKYLIYNFDGKELNSKCVNINSICISEIEILNQSLLTLDFTDKSSGTIFSVKFASKSESPYLKRKIDFRYVWFLNTNREWMVENTIDVRMTKKHGG
jgi:hypothetical protein